MTSQPERGRRHIQLAYGHISAGDYIAALQQLERAFECDRANDEVHRLFALCLLRTGHIRDAYQASGAALRLDPQSAENHHIRALTSQELRLVREAEEEYLSAIHLAPFTAHYHSNYARMLCEQGDFARALTPARTAADLDRGMGDACEILAWAEIGLAHWESARVHCLESLRLQPNSPWAHNNMGVWYMAHGEGPKAHAEFAEALRLKPDFEEARGNALRSLQSRHPLFAILWRLTAWLLHLPPVWRAFAGYSCAVASLAIGSLVGWWLGGETGRRIGNLMVVALLLGLTLLFSTQQLYIWCVRRGWLR